MKSLMLRHGSALLFAIACGTAAACEGLAVTDAWVREPPPGASAIAVYMTLTNTGDRTLVVDGLTGPGFAHGMLHQTVLDGGQVRMRHVTEIPLAPGQSVKLTPGALHGMLMQPRDALPRAGDRITLVIGCGETTTEVEAPVVVDAP